MTTPRVRSPYQDLSKVNWATAIPEAIATGDCKAWCHDISNINYRTFQRRRAAWEKSDDKAHFKFIKQTNVNKLLTSGGTREGAYHRFLDMYVVPKKPRNNKTVMQCLVDVYAERHPEQPPLDLDSGCVNTFKREFDLGDFAPVYRTANKANVPDSVIEAFQSELRRVMEDSTLDKSMIMNADSTTFNCINPSGAKCVSPRGQQAEVNQKLNTNHRILLHNTITASGDVLNKWYVIADAAHFKFTGVRRSLKADFATPADYNVVRSQISAAEGSKIKIRRDVHNDMYADKSHTVLKNDDDFVDITSGGGLTQNAFIKYIDAVIVPYTNNQRCVLMVDAATIGHSELTYAKVRRHNIDVSVFGPAKKKLRTRDDEYLMADNKPDLRRAITAMSLCIDEMKDTIAKTFTYIMDSPPDVLRRNKIKTKTKSSLPVRSASAPF